MGIQLIPYKSLPGGYPAMSWVVKPRSIFWLVSYYPWLLKVGYWLIAKQRSRRQISSFAVNCRVWLLQNGSHFGGIKELKFMAILRDFPYKNALFGLVLTSCCWMWQKSLPLTKSPRMASSGDTREKQGEPKMGSQQRRWDWDAFLAPTRKKRSRGMRSSWRRHRCVSFLPPAGRAWNGDALVFGICRRFEFVCYDLF